MTLQYRILNCLERGNFSIKEIAQRVFASHQQTCKIINELVEQKLVHINSWRRSERGPFTRVFALGRGDGVFPLKPKTYGDAERCKRWRQSGGDTHKSYRLRRDAKRIARSMTMAGQLGLRTESPSC